MWLALGAVTSLLAVGFGAFGAHGLRERLSPEMLTIFEIGVRYQMYHGLAIVAVAALGGRRMPAPAALAGICFLVGVVLFSGSLYVLALSGVRGWGAVTPIGGVFFLLGWACLAGLGWSMRQRRGRY